MADSAVILKDEPFAGPSTYLLIFLTILTFGYFLFRRKDVMLPPGPRHVPVLGSMPFIGPDLHKEAQRFCKEFNSDVITIYLGSNVAIFLNSFDTIKEAFTGDKFVDRPHHNIGFEIFERRGIASNSGKPWQQQRKLSLSLLRDLGLGKMAAEEHVREEIGNLLTAIGKNGAERFNIRYILMLFSANIICATIFGQSYDYNDDVFIDFLDTIKEFLSLLGGSALLNVFPSLRHVPLFSAGTLRRNLKRINDFIWEHVKKHDESLGSENVPDFLYSYLAEKRQQNAKDPNGTFTDQQMLTVLSDLFLAGTETTSATLEWCILYMIAFPDIQTKVQAEIDEVLDREQLPTMHDRRRLPYTEATLLEVQRCASVAPIAGPHTNAKHDVPFRGFTIPKGAMVFPNIWAVHRDPNHWKSPNEFDPRNFLDDGCVVYKNEMIPFGIGRRQCLGESLARMEIFLAFVTLLQRFRFSNPEGAPKPNVEGIFAIVNEPAPFEICVCPRV